MPGSTYYVDIFHEIKNSVSLINSYLQLIEKKYPEIVRFDYWETSRIETGRLRSIVAEMSQLKFGEDLQLETMDLKAFLTDCCNTFFCHPEDENITCVLSLPETPLFLEADARQLRHAIINLLKNSCEAMEHNGRIIIHAFAKDYNAHIQITDFGCGISPSLIDSVFEPFVSTKEDGSGLGLHITKQIITGHNGTISVVSKEGYGCTFTILLPLFSFDTESLP